MSVQIQYVRTAAFGCRKIYDSHLATHKNLSNIRLLFHEMLAILLYMSHQAAATHFLLYVYRQMFIS